MNTHVCCQYINSKAIRTTREMITKRISGQQKQPGSFILQAEPLSRSYHVAVSICTIYNRLSVAYHPWVTVTLTLASDLVSRNCIGSVAYLLCSWR